MDAQCAACGMGQCRLGSSAPPHLTLTHYTELKESKGIVLVRGDVLSPHIVSVPEVRLIAYGTSGCSFQAVNWSPSYGYLNRSMLASTRSCKNHNHFHFYDTSGCSSLVISWLPSNGYLNRSVLASERLCNNHIIICRSSAWDFLFGRSSRCSTLQVEF